MLLGTPTFKRLINKHKYLELKHILKSGISDGSLGAVGSIFVDP